MKTKLLILSLFTSAIVFGQNAEETAEPITKNYHRIGIQADATTGIGFSYKLSHNDKYQFQLVGIPIASASDKFYSVGFTFFRKVINTRNFDILAYAGGGYQYNKYESYDYYYDPYGPYNPDDYYGTTTVVDEGATASFGVAFEVFPSELFKLCFKGGYGIYDMFDSTNWQTLPSVGVGVEFGLNQILSKN